MAQVFDEKDYRRRLAALATSEISVREEAGLIWQGWVTATGSGPLDARKAIMEAKREALRQARKEMIRAIVKAEQDQAVNGGLPTEVEQIVTGPSDELIKV
ncbi:hypothetical protein [Bradyrhizobium sp. WSM4349]|uniref:hypothetical protein n=1 Tax=Bradyrhizobium sp. WSM4349 TaxID=1040988 RepID=UPI000372B8AA|nr:hypothetical protein [Bradyrhizobium sp. WSM4349]